MGVWMVKKWGLRNTHVNSSCGSWIRAKTPRMPTWVRASGAGNHGDIACFWDLFQCNCWSSPFSFLYLNKSYSRRPEIHSLAICYAINPLWQGQWKIKMHCQFTQLSTLAQSGRNKRRSASTFLSRSTSASVHPDRQIKAQWKEWSEHEPKQIPPQAWSRTALLKGRRCTGFVQHIGRRF